MRTRLPWLLLLALLVPAAARADDHRADIFGAYSYAEGSALHGFHASFGFTSPKPIKRDLSFVVDFSVHAGSSEGTDLTRVAYLFGARWAIANEKKPKVVPSLHAAVGGVSLSAGRDEGHAVAGAVGATLDYLPWRDRTEQGLGVRIQIDYVFRHGAPGSTRASAGVVYRFKKD